MLDKELLKVIDRIEIGTRVTIDEVMAGAYHSSFKGNGMEFSEVREYVPGDDVRTIDWNVTARTGVPHVKKFIEERELTLMLAVDLSPSAAFGSRSQLKSEVMATVGALLAFSAIRNNDKVGLLVFTSEVELLIPPAKGRRHALNIVRQLLYFEPKGHGTDLSAAMSHLGGILRRRAVVVVLSDFLDQGYQKPLRALRRRHDVLAIGVRDPRELELPDAGFVELEDPETGETLFVDTSDEAFRDAFAREARRDEKQRTEDFRRAGVDYVPVLVRDDYQATIAPLLTYFRRRAEEVRRGR